MGESIEDITKPVAEAVIAKLLVLLGEWIEDQKMVDAIAPTIPALVAVALAEGQAAAEQCLAGLTGSDPYPHWQTLIKHADPRTRIQIMETQRQAAIRETLEKIQRDEKWQTLLSYTLKALFMIVPLLL